MHTPQLWLHTLFFMDMTKLTIWFSSTSTLNWLLLTQSEHHEWARALHLWARLSLHFMYHQDQSTCPLGWCMSCRPLLGWVHSLWHVPNALTRRCKIFRSKIYRGKMSLGLHTPAEISSSYHLYLHRMAPCNSPIEAMTSKHGCTFLQPDSAAKHWQFAINIVRQALLLCSISWFEGQSIHVHQNITTCLIQIYID